MSHTVIVYFSRAGENWTPAGKQRLRVGNTARAAGILEELTGADAFKIEPAVPYAEDYDTCVQQAHAQLQIGARPALARWPVDELDGCRCMILCYPNYCGTMPMPVWTFLARYDWTGITILPLCTHEGDGLGRSEEDLRALTYGADRRPGLAIQGSAVRGAAADIELWLRQNGIPLIED